jgi:basic membrane lipoprotein Med (substrate-binding protein (PBP1-ABC) superfamily)
MGAAGAFLAATPILAACGDDDDDDTASASGTDTTAAGGSTDTTAAGGGGTAPAGDVQSIGFAYVGPISDNGWTAEHDRGRLAVEELGFATNYVENVPFGPEATQIFEELAQNNQIVIVNSEYADLLIPAIEAHPEVWFFEANGHLAGQYPNYTQYYVAHEGLAYAMGVAAGHLSESGQLGYVGAFPTATLYNDTNGFLLGARSVNPDATLQVVLISSYIDPPGATQAANALIDAGCDVLFDVQDDTSVLQVCEEREVWSCIWNRDNRQFGPTAFVNALQLDFGPYYTEVVQAIAAGTYTAPAEVALLTPGDGIELAGWGDNVSDEAKAAGDEARAALDSGFRVYAGPLNDADGNEVVPAGTELTDLEVYQVDFSVEGVTVS